jgi:hypothetical protein
MPHPTTRMIAVLHQVFEAKAKMSLMSSRDGGAGFTEADVKVAVARLQARLSL